jgi:hypothetical protein
MTDQIIAGLQDELYGASPPISQKADRNVSGNLEENNMDRTTRRAPMRNAMTEVPLSELVGKPKTFNDAAQHLWHSADLFRIMVGIGSIFLFGVSFAAFGTQNYVGGLVCLTFGAVGLVSVSFFGGMLRCIAAIVFLLIEINDALRGDHPPDSRRGDG